MQASLHYLLMADHLLFHKALLASVQDTGLTSGQPKVLDYLREHDGAIQREIAAACHIEPATLTSLLSGMEQKGLISRKMLPGNRRSLYVYLTEQGKALAARIDAAFARIEAAALRGLDAAERDALTALLEKIRQNMHSKEAVSDV